MRLLRVCILQVVERFIRSSLACVGLQYVLETTCSEVCSLVHSVMSIVPIVTYPVSTHRLFCFPHVGGNAKSFGWVCPSFERLQQPSDDISIELYGVNWRDPTSTRPSISEVVEKLRNAFFEAGYVKQQGINDQKIVFFGHSIGAILAFELIRQFENEGIYDVVHLVCSSAPSPKELTLVNKSLNAPKRCKDTDSALYAHLHEIGGIPEGLHPEFFKKSTNAIRADYHLLESYLFDPSTTYLSNLDFNEGRITCPLTTVRGVADLTVSFEAMSKWRDNTVTATRHDEFGNLICGDHFYYNHPMIRDSLLNLLKKICMMPISTCANDRDGHQDNEIRRERESSFSDSSCRFPSSSNSPTQVGRCMSFY